MFSRAVLYLPRDSWSSPRPPWYGWNVDRVSLDWLYDRSHPESKRVRPVDRLLLLSRRKNWHHWIYCVVDRELSIGPDAPYCPVMLWESSRSEPKLSNSLDYRFLPAVAEYDCCRDTILEHELTTREGKETPLDRERHSNTCRRLLTSLIEFGRIVTLLLLKSNRSHCSSRQFWISRLMS